MANTLLDGAELAVEALRLLTQSLGAQRCELYPGLVADQDERVQILTAELRFTSADLTRTIDSFSRGILERPMRDLARALQAMATGGRLLRFYGLDLPLGLDVAERCSDPSRGLSTRLLRCFDIRENLFRSVVQVAVSIEDTPESAYAETLENFHDYALSE